MNIRTLIPTSLLAAGLLLGMSPAAQAHDLDRLHDNGRTCNIDSHYDYGKYGDRHHHWQGGKRHWDRGDGHHQKDRYQHGRRDGHHKKYGQRYDDGYGNHKKHRRDYGYWDRHDRTHKKGRHGDRRHDAGYKTRGKERFGQYRDVVNTKDHGKGRHHRSRDDARWWERRHDDTSGNRRNRS